MSDAEFQALIAWLIRCQQQDPHAPKFIACPAMPLPRSLRMLGGSSDAIALRSDGWEGYPQSLRQLLGYIAVHGIDNVVFLSGDAHLSCIATVTLQAEARAPVTAYSIHSSALYAPFPFANSDKGDFPHKDVFEFEVDPVSPSADDIENAFVHRHCRCEVSTKFAPRHDGFAIVRIESQKPKVLVCEFVRHDHTEGNKCGKVWKRELPLV
jgi:cholesterol oxidase